MDIFIIFFGVVGLAFGFANFYLVSYWRQKHLYKKDNWNFQKKREMEMEIRMKSNQLAGIRAILKEQETSENKMTPESLISYLKEFLKFSDN